jgi:cytidylate kinase
MNKNIITIDGPAASGKGTLARRLADHLHYFYLDTGKIYRLVGLEAYNLGVTPEDDPDVIAAIAKQLASNFDVALMDNPRLKSDIIGQMASRSSQFQNVRDAVLDLQRSLAHNPPNDFKGSVLDGRDCGTVICPQAQHKFFVTADVETRANRRFEELKSNSETISYDNVLSEMRVRDDRDTNRTHAPLKPAEGAIVVDTSDMSIDEAFELIRGHL